MRRQRRKQHTLDEMLDMPTPPEYVCRFVPHEDRFALVNLYHLARTALSGKPYAEQSPYHRMLWASREYARTRPAVSANGAYKDLCGLLGR